MLPLEELEDPGARELYLALEEWWRNEAPPPGEGGSLLPEGLLSRVSNEALKTFVFEQNAGGAFSGDPERLVTDSVKRLRQKRLARRQREIVIAMRTRKDQNGVSGRRTLEDLLAEKIHVDDELQRLQGNW
jgi:DNA primase